jgi:hypothetical protein
MKLFIVASYLLLAAVAEGFQPLHATNMVTPPLLMKNDMASPNIKEGTFPKKPPRARKVVAPVAPVQKGIPIIKKVVPIAPKK